MIKVFDNLFAHDFLVEANKEAHNIPWKYSNTANRSQYPKSSILSPGSHKFFGCKMYQHKSRYTIKNSTPEIFTEVLDHLIENVIQEDLFLSQIDSNLQIYGQEGTAHRDIYLGEGRDRTILFYPHYEWREEWGGQLELLDENENVVEKLFPMPGRVIYFDSEVLHRAVAPCVPNIGRMSIAYRMGTQN